MSKKEAKKTASKKETEPKKVGASKADVLAAVAELPKASNLVVNDAEGTPQRFETVKREDVKAMINKLL